jgi:hypothetical protein
MVAAMCVCVCVCVRVCEKEGHSHAVPLPLPLVWGIPSRDETRYGGGAAGGRGAVTLSRS